MALVLPIRGLPQTAAPHWLQRSMIRLREKRIPTTRVVEDGGHFQQRLIERFWMVFFLVDVRDGQIVPCARDPAGSTR